MRHRISTYTIDGQDIVLGLEFDDLTLADIRLIVNETQKKVLCSSMQKDKGITLNGTHIVIPADLCTLAVGDTLTIEVDTGDTLGDVVADLTDNATTNKQAILDALPTDYATEANATTNTATITTAIGTTQTALETHITNEIASFDSALQDILNQTATL